MTRNVILVEDDSWFSEQVYHRRRFGDRSVASGEQASAEAVNSDSCFHHVLYFLRLLNTVELHKGTNSHACHDPYKMRLTLARVQLESGFHESRNYIYVVPFNHKR